MKKFIEICSLFILLVVFCSAAATAQSSYGSEVAIPFAFNIGDRSHAAGTYIVKLEKFPTGSAILSLQDTNTDDFQTVVLSTSGDEPGKEVKLVFDTIEGRRYLSKIRTPDRTYAIAKSKAQKDAAKARNIDKPTAASPAGETVN